MGFRTADARIQFPIGKGPGAPFPELHVALRIQDAFLPEQPDFFPAFLHLLSPFQYDGPESGLRQGQGDEHSRRAKPCNQRSECGISAWLRQRILPLRRRGKGRCRLPGQRVFLFHGNIDGVKEVDAVPFPGVDAAADDMQLLQLRRFEAQYGGSLFPQLIRLVFIRCKDDIPDPQHITPLRHFCPPGRRWTRPIADCIRRSPRRYPAPHRRHKAQDKACFPWFRHRIGKSGYPPP